MGKPVAPVATRQRTAPWGRRYLGAVLAGVFIAAAAAPTIVAQEASSDFPVADADLPFLFINQERLLTGSQVGQRLLAEEEAESEELRAEARAIDTAFEDEERRLTEQRTELSPEEFRELADDFDRRVIEARAEQDARSDALAQRFDLRRRQFYASIAPVLVQLMDRYEAKAILDETSVLLADQSINITDAVIAEIDATIVPPEPGAEPPAAGDD